MLHTVYNVPCDHIGFVLSNTVGTHKLITEKECSSQKVFCSSRYLRLVISLNPLLISILWRLRAIFLYPTIETACISPHLPPSDVVELRYSIVHTFSGEISPWIDVRICNMLVIKRIWDRNFDSSSSHHLIYSYTHCPNVHVRAFVSMEVKKWKQ